MTHSKSVKILLIASLFLGLTPLTMNSAMAQPVIYGAAHTGQNGPSTLYTIDATTGVATSVGAVGFERCSGMDFDSSGTLFATCERSDGSNVPVLVTINTATGAGTEVGPTALSGQISDMSFRNSDGKLYAFDATASDHTLNTISTATGAGTLVGSTGLGADGGNGMAFSPADTLYHIARDDGLHTLDQTTGAASAGTAVTYPAGFLGGSIKAMDYDSSSGTLYGIAQDDLGATDEFLVTIDVTGPTVTIIGQTTDDMDAIAIAPHVQAVGGELLSLDMTALFVTGIFANALWMIPAIVGITGTGIYFAKSRKTEEN